MHLPEIIIKAISPLLKEENTGHASLFRPTPPLFSQVNVRHDRLTPSPATVYTWFPFV